METAVKPISKINAKAIAIDILHCAMSGRVLSDYMREKYGWSKEVYEDTMHDYKTTLMR